MKCLLVIPPYNEFGSSTYFYIMPMGMAYINTAMRQAGLDVTCINLNGYEYEESFCLLAEKIKKDSIGCVMCGALSASWRILKKVFSTAKAVSPDIITIGGGGAYTSDPIPAAELTEVDYAVLGEGEITDVELVQTLIAGGDVSKVKGILYKEDGVYKRTPPREEIMDLDTIAFPSYEEFGMEEYLDSQKLSYGYYLNKLDNPRAISMILGRSCPYNCKFCFHPSGSKYRIRSLDNFFEELDMVMEKYHPNCILVLDELFSANVDRIYEFCKRIEPYRLNWLCQMRVDIVTKELLETMKKAGCHSICYGLESYSPTVLKNMRKHIDIAQIDRALEVTYNAGVDIEANFIFGDEMEDMHTFYETMSWWFRNRKYAIHLLMIETYPGTGYYEEMVRKGKIEDRKQFLQDGHFVINLTKDAEVMNKISVVITLLNVYFVQELLGELLDLYTDEEGKIVLVTKCRHCGAVNRYVGISETAFNPIVLQLGCRSCGHRNMYYTVDTRALPNYDRLEYLCRMMSEAKNEADFIHAVDTLYMVYLQLRDPERPFPI